MLTMIFLRRLPEFEYFTPKSLKEAGSLLREYAGMAKVMAGGTDLLVSMKYRTKVARCVVGLKKIPGLDSITYSKDKGLRLGPLVTHQSITDSPVITESYGVLARACSKVGTPQIRNMGTVGGNLCNAAPSADLAPSLIALSAEVKLVNPEGERIVLLEQFFTGPGETVLLADEILTEIQVPKLPSHTGVVYLKLPARTAVDIAVVGVAVLISVDSEKGTCTDAKIVLGSVSPTPARAKKAEGLLIGKKVENDLILAAVQSASEECRPISDVRGSADYRVEMVKVLTKNAISQSLEQARSV